MPQSTQLSVPMTCKMKACRNVIFLQSSFCSAWAYSYLPWRPGHGASVWEGYFSPQVHVHWCFSPVCNPPVIRSYKIREAMLKRVVSHFRYQTWYANLKISSLTPFSFLLAHTSWPSATKLSCCLQVKKKHISCKNMLCNFFISIVIS